MLFLIIGKGIIILEIGSYYGRNGVNPFNHDRFEILALEWIELINSTADKLVGSQDRLKLG